MINLKLPWPGSALSPNGSHGHWAKRAKAKKLYRAACSLLVLGHQPPPVPDGPLALTLTFHPPDRRRYDRDNLCSRMKAGLDGMCDALRIDDVRFASVTARVGDVVADGEVVVRITREAVA